MPEHNSASTSRGAMRRKELPGIDLEAALRVHGDVATRPCLRDMRILPQQQPAGLLPAGSGDMLADRGESLA